MTAAKRKGTEHETNTVGFLNRAFRGRYGLKAYRPAQTGAKDVGDVHGVSPFVIQAKNWKDLAGAVREGVDGVEQQKVYAGEPYGVAVVKRYRKPYRDNYAVMNLQTFARLLLRLRRAESLIPEGKRARYLAECKHDSETPLA